MNCRTSITVFSALTLVVSAGLLTAGPITPPDGAVTSTYKTLSEVEPRIAVNATNTPGQAANELRIVQPGSYYLTGNLEGKNLSIVADDVTLDLSGFRVNGGTIAAGAMNRITVRNGTVTGAAQTGISLDSCTSSTVENVRVVNCGGYGIRPGKRAQVRGCHMSQCAMGGFYGRESTRIEDCSASQCTGFGFSGEGGNQFVHCTASNNNGDGFSGGSLLESCVSQTNSGKGFVVLGDAIGCRAANNTGDGFLVQGRAEKCASAYNQGIGFTCARGANLRACRAEGNEQQGIRANGNFVQIADCFAIDNGAPGIAGIWISANYCQVQGNQSSGNGWGYFISSGITGTYMVGNTAVGNSTGNFNPVPASNHVAPIVNGPGFNSFSTTTPLSNISY